MASDNEDEEIFLPPEETKDLFFTPAKEEPYSPELGNFLDYDSEYNSELDKDCEEGSTESLSSDSDEKSTVSAGIKRKRDFLDTTNKDIPSPMTQTDYENLHSSMLKHPSCYEEFLQLVIIKLNMILNRFHRKTRGYFYTKGNWKNIPLGPMVWTSSDIRLGFKKAMITFEPMLGIYPFEEHNMHTLVYRGAARDIFERLTIAITECEKELNDCKELRESVIKRRKSIK